MATLEMVEKLRQHANVSYDEAKAALDACGDDLLEAIIYLERQGKVHAPQGGGYYSSKQEQPPANVTVLGSQPHGHAGETFGGMMRRFGEWLLKILHKGNTNNFEVWRHDHSVMSVPVTVLVLLTVFCFWFVLPALIIGLFFDCSYKFRGPELDDTKVNAVMDSAAKAADTLKNEVIFPDKDKKGKEE